jgi:long-subunit fatty acid transport protein
MAAGLSIAIITGKSVDNLAEHNQASDWFVLEKYPQPVEYDVQAAVIDSSKFSGVTFTLGLKYFTPKSAIGAVIKLPYTLRQTTDRTLRLTTTVNGLEYTNGSGVIFQDGNVLDIEMPMMIGVGGSYKPNQSTTLAADVEYRPFSGKEVQIRDSIRLVPGAKDQEFFHSEDPQWRNVLILRGGAERLVSTKSTVFPVIPVRGGFGFMPIPAPNYTNGQPSGTATSINFSLGSGVHWSLLHLDVAYTFRSLKQTYSADYGTTEANGKSHLFYVTFTGYF